MEPLTAVWCAASTRKAYGAQESPLPSSSLSDPLETPALSEVRIDRSYHAFPMPRQVTARQSPCGANGRCERGATECTCYSGWTGVLCDQPLCPAGCSGRGVCRDGACACNDGWAGLDCATPEPCPRGWAPSGGGQRACSGRGTCKAGTCKCFHGYKGAACELTECYAGCNGHGHCQLNGTCTCDVGFAGFACELRTCIHLSDCHGRGVCNDGECACDAGWTGPSCDVPECPHDCGPKGSCDVRTGKCRCRWVSDSIRQLAHDRDALTEAARLACSSPTRTHCSVRTAEHTLLNARFSTHVSQRTLLNAHCSTHAALRTLLSPLLSQRRMARRRLLARPWLPA